MNELNIPNNALLIVANDMKRNVLRKLNSLSINNTKVLSLTEVRNKFYFSYDERSIYYLMRKYGYTLDVAKMYLSRLYEVDDNDFNSPKIRKIIDSKNELIESKMLIYTPNFVKYLKSKKVIFYNLDNLDKSTKKMLDEISSICDVEYYNETKEEYTHNSIFEFNTIEDEVVYIASRICDLKKENISFNNIKLCGAKGEYISIIKRIFKMYNIPINIQDNYLYSTKMAVDFLNNLNDDINITLKYIEEKYSLTKSENLEIYNKIIRILNDYAWTDSYLDIKCFIEDDFKNTTINNTSYLEEIEIINSLSNASDSDYVFLMGFNQGDIPKTYKDESYFNDTLKEKLGLETTNELNKRIYNTWTYQIKTTKNLIITSKQTSSLGVHYLSSLNDDLNLEVVRPKLKYNYSNLHNKLLLAEKIDTYIKYGEKEEDLELLYSNYKDIPYCNFTNDYTSINKDKLKKYLDNKLVLSYSSMNTYYQCAFRYYLSNVLKLNIFEETFYTVLGNLFHYILSIALKKDIDLHKEYYDYISRCTYEFNSREKFFLSILEKELELIINTIKKQNEVNTLNNVYYEDKIEIDKSREDLKVTFKGFIDKMLLDDSKNTLAIVDYKTGNPDLNLNNIIYGLDMQLPVYIYLARHRFPNTDIAGFYLQKILNNEISKDYKHTYECLKEDKLKLQGYSNSNISILEKFDSSYNESKMIKGMRTTSKGLGTKKVLNNEQIDKLESITEEKIDEATDNILNANFNINPKRIGMNNLGCKYCNFKDICFFNEKNIENLKEYKNMEFLGGEENDTN